MEQAGSNEWVSDPRLRVLLAGVERYLRSIDEGWWTPADDEDLVRLVIPDWSFPWSSVPSPERLAEGCDRYQRLRSDGYSFPPVPADDAAPEVKIAYLEDRIRAIASRRGQDLCHETDGLGQLREPAKSDEKRRMNASYDLRCTHCQYYRHRLYGALPRS